MKHAFPVADGCYRHCLDCGLHPGWRNTTGTQCSIKLPITTGDSFRFRLHRAEVNVTYPFDGHMYKGDVYALEVTRGPSIQTFNVGRIFFEDGDGGGVTRLGAFHEHIGCTPCNAFFESEERTGPWFPDSNKRDVSINFTRPTAECRLFNVIIKDGPSAIFRTGPGSCSTSSYGSTTQNLS